MEKPIRIGISACLLGNRVRFDGGHKRDSFVTKTLGNYFDWIVVCPEVEIGLGTPRDSLQLRVDGLEGKTRLVFGKNGREITQMMTAYSESKCVQLSDQSLSGFILKKNSPSCGMERVKLYAASGTANREGVGLFAQALLTHFPNLPIEEEGRLSDPRLRENWVERVFVYHRLQQLWAKDWKLRDLIQFHTEHKLTLLSHSPKGYQDLGRLVAGAKAMPAPKLKAAYETQLMQAMAKIASPGRNANVLQHMMGYLKNRIDEPARKELSGLIEDYQKGLVPLVVPITLLAHYVRRLEIKYLLGQTYLTPHPKELALRNHV